MLFAVHNGAAMQVRCDYVIKSSYYGFVPQFGVQSGSDQVHEIFSLGQTPNQTSLESREPHPELDRT